MKGQNKMLKFSNPSFDNSIIGTSSDDRIIYDYDKMVEELMMEDNCSMEDAIDFIQYNTIRSLDYLNEKDKPIILYRDYDKDEKYEKEIKKMIEEYTKDKSLYINKSDLVERFVKINKDSWTLLQILANINMIIEKRM